MQGYLSADTWRLIKLVEKMEKQQVLAVDLTAWRRAFQVIFTKVEQVEQETCRGICQQIHGG